MLGQQHRTEQPDNRTTGGPWPLTRIVAVLAVALAYFPVSTASATPGRRTSSLSCTPAAWCSLTIDSADMAAARTTARPAPATRLTHSATTPCPFQCADVAPLANQIVGNWNPGQDEFTVTQAGALKYNIEWTSGVPSDQCGPIDAQVTYTGPQSYSVDQTIGGPSAYYSGTAPAYDLDIDGNCLGPDPAGAVPITLELDTAAGAIPWQLSETGYAFGSCTPSPAAPQNTYSCNAGPPGGDAIPPGQPDPTTTTLSCPPTVPLGRDFTCTMNVTDTKAGPPIFGAAGLIPAPDTSPNIAEEGSGGPGAFPCNIGPVGLQICTWAFSTSAPGRAAVNVTYPGDGNDTLGSASAEVCILGAKSGPSNACAAPVTLAALGDSYSSGVGAANPKGGCFRSSEAWPELVPGLVNQSYGSDLLDPKIDFLACSGALTQPDAGGNLLAQIHSLPSGSKGPDLITVTTGGNDGFPRLGFTDVLETCLSFLRCENEVLKEGRLLRYQEPAVLDTRLANFGQLISERWSLWSATRASSLIEGSTVCTLVAR